MRTFPALAALVAVAAIGFTVVHRHVESRTAASAEEMAIVECACPAFEPTPVDELGDLLLPVPGSAQAGPQRITQLASSDAGSTLTFQLLAKKCYCVQPTLDSQCINLDLWDGGNHTVDCTKDYALDSTAYQTNSMAPGIPNRATPYCFDTANATALAAMQTDGGVVNLNVFLLSQNPVSPNYACSIPVQDRKK